MSNEQTHAHEHTHHVDTVFTYFKTYLALCVFFGLTYWAAAQDFGVLNNIIAMTIAVIKAVIVVLIFMGVKNSSKVTKLWAAAGFVWFLLIFGIMGDYLTRAWNALPGWQ